MNFKDRTKILLDHFSTNKKNTSIMAQSFEDPNLGVRKAMEDFTIVLDDVVGDKRYSFYCVLDGHGGAIVAKYVKKSYPKILRIAIETYKNAYQMENILKMTITQIDNQLKIIGARNCGSTFCGILIDKSKDVFYSVNIGDSRALQVKYDEFRNGLNSHFLNEEHKVSDIKEKERIEKSGGLVMNERLGGNLLVSRSLGDFDMKKYGLISTPDIKEVPNKSRSIIFIASDGIWDVIGA